MAESKLPVPKLHRCNRRSLNFRQVQETFNSTQYFRNKTAKRYELSKTQSNSLNKGISQLKDANNKMLTTYSDLEYLFKDMNGSKVVNWAVSLRKKAPSAGLVRGRPPSFWDNDMQKWRKRFELTNTQELNDIHRIRNNYNLCFHESTKTRSLSRFTTNDSILLRGNASPYSEIIGNRKLGRVNVSQINFPLLLRNYEPCIKARSSASTLKKQDCGIYRPVPSL
eukprot:TRINITY_DN3154_c0_g2_i1.p1 TRINITY_DN3154_c0_g2~~TRINITY_DN3154_c0_g2_i1.p1  ORF type:complete len:243 (-),score=36.76 TRINITY_DN3154_c0_g2_i1:35-706(-)